MIGRKPRFQIAITILKILEKRYPHTLRYKELEKEVNLRCKGKKPSTRTFTKYLNQLSGRESQYSRFIYKGVLNRKVEEDCSTHYSLTKEFRDSLDIQKGASTTTYIQYTLSLAQFSVCESKEEKAIEIIEPSENEESTKDKKV